MFSWFREFWFYLFGWRKQLLFNLLERVEMLEADNRELKAEMGQIATYCDKCLGRLAGCLKCGGRGIITKSQLMSWKW